MLNTFSCSSTNETREVIDKVDLDLNAKAYISLKNHELSDTLFLRFWAYNAFPPSISETAVLKLFEEDSAFFELIIQHPKYAYIDHLHNGIKNTHRSPRQHIFLQPGDTMSIEIVSADSLDGPYHWPVTQKAQMTSEGRNQQMIDYVKKRNEVLAYDLDYFLIETINKIEDFELFEFKLDSLEKVETTRIKNLISEYDLPNWFAKMEISECYYKHANNRTKALSLRENIYGFNDNISSTYHQLVDSLPHNLNAAVASKHYTRFIADYIYHNSVNVNSDTFKIYDNVRYYEKVITAKQMFKQNDLDIYLANEAIRYIYKNDIDSNNIKLFLNNIENPILKEFVADYFAAPNLENGDNAPQLTGIDKDNKPVSLSEYKGKYILLKFWFEGCHGCMAEMPYEKALVEKFKSEPFEFVSVCVHTNESRWMKLVEKHGLNENAIRSVNTENDKKLKSDYQIYSYPHYVLIDMEGKVIENKTKRRPSGTIDELIHSQLYELIEPNTL